MKIQKIPNSKYFYELNQNVLVLRKRLLSKSNAVTTFIYLCFALFFLSMIIIFGDLTKLNLSAIIYFSIFSIVHVICFFYCILSLVWKPKLFIFNNNYMHVIKTKEKFYYSEVKRIDIVSFQSSDFFRLSFKIQNLSLQVFLTNDISKELVKIQNSKNIKDLEFFKDIISKKIFNKEN